MSTVTLPDVRPATSENDEEGLHHYVCCDEDIALCGLDLADYPPLVDGPDPDDTICPLCAHVFNEGLPCTVPGCPGRERE